MMGIMFQLRRTSWTLVSCLAAGSLLLAIRFADSAPNLRNDDWTKTARAFQQALASGNPEWLDKAAKAVVADNSKRSMELVLKALKTTGAPSYWTLIGALGKASSEESLAAIGEEILAGKVPELKRDLIMSLRLCESAATGPVLRRILKEGTPDLQVSAMDEVVDRFDLEAVPLLLDIAEKDPKAEKELTRRVFRALRAFAKESPKAGPVEWREWWRGIGEGVKADGTQMKPGVVGATVTETLRRARVTDYEDLKKASKDDILVITGGSDSVQDVLFRLSIPHTVASADKVERGENLGLEKYCAVFINCGPQGWPSTQIQRIRTYVAEGGYLCVTDLIIQNLIKDAFPGYYINKGGLPDMTVGIVPWKGSTGHPLLRGVDMGLGNVATSASRVEWAIAPGGPALTFDAKKVVWLVDAPELALKRKPTGVAVTFLFGADTQVLSAGIESGGVYEELCQLKAGRVLCVLSHFGKQRQGEDGFALQNLLINFLIEARDRKLMREDAANRKK